MGSCASFGNQLISAERHVRFATEKMHDRRHRCRVLGTLLTVGRVEEDRLDLLVLMQRATKGSFDGRLTVAIRW